MAECSEALPENSRAGQAGVGLFGAVEETVSCEQCDEGGKVTCGWGVCTFLEIHVFHDAALGVLHSTVREDASSSSVNDTVTSTRVIAEPCALSSD